MGPESKLKARGFIVFDHDGTLVNTDKTPFILFPGMRELLVDLKALEFELYIWTARNRKSVIKTIIELEIIDFFTDIYCYDDGLPKPNPVGLLKLTEGMSKEKILHIGDSPTDFIGAHDYGIEVVAACWNRQDLVYEYQKLADYTALDLKQCLETIKGKFNV